MSEQKLTTNAKKAQDDFLGSLKIAKRKTKQPIIIAMLGLVGSGKSSVARELAKLIGGTMITNDQIRICLRQYGEPLEVAIKTIAENAAKTVLEKGGSLILDGDWVGEIEREKLLKKAKSVGVKVFFVRTVTDYTTIIARLCNGKYSKDKIFKDVTVAVREMWRRTPHHHYWENKGGGNWVLKKFPFVDFEIDTTDQKKWKSKIKKMAAELKRDSSLCSE